jgi:hypothetical protein
MVQIIRKASLPTPDEVTERTRAAAEQATMSPCASLAPPDFRFCSLGTGS